jgi:hypothetical protein
MLRDVIRQEIDKLSESQLKRIAEFIALVKLQPQAMSAKVPFWKSATPTERAQDFRVWVEQLPKTGLSLPDEAFDRSSIYE